MAPLLKRDQSRSPSTKSYPGLSQSKKTYPLRHSTWIKEDDVAQTSGRMGVLGKQFAGVRKALKPALEELRRRYKDQLERTMQHEAVMPIFHDVEEYFHEQRKNKNQETENGPSTPATGEEYEGEDLDEEAAQLIAGSKEIIGTMSARSAMRAASSSRDGRAGWDVDTTHDVKETSGVTKTQEQHEDTNNLPYAETSNIYNAEQEQLGQSTETLFTWRGSATKYGSSGSGVCIRSIKQTKWSKRGPDFVPHGWRELRMRAETRRKIRMRQARVENPTVVNRSGGRRKRTR